MGQTEKGIILVLFAAFSFAFKGIFAKLAYAEGATVDMVLYYRFLIAVPLFWVAVLAFGKRKAIFEVTPRQWLVTFLGGILFGFSSFADFSALDLIDASVERVILFSFPAFVILLKAIIHRRPPSKALTVSFLVTELGIILVMMGQGKAGFFESWQGNVWALTAAFVYACYLIVGERGMKSINSMIFTSAVNSWTLVFMAIYMFSMGGELDAQVTTAGNVYIFTIAVFCTVIPFLALFKGMQILGSEQAALLNMIGPLVTVIGASSILGEQLTWLQLVGALIVVSGVAISQPERLKNLPFIQSWVRIG